MESKNLIYKCDDLPYISIRHSDYGEGNVINIDEQNWEIEFKKLGKIECFNMIQVLTDGVIKFDKNSEELINPNLKLGTQVKHPDYGMGIIIGEQSEDEMVVLFEGEIKTIKYGKPRYSLKFTSSKNFNCSRFFKKGTQTSPVAPISTPTSKFQLKYDFKTAVRIKKQTVKKINKEEPMKAIKIRHNDYGDGDVIDLKDSKITIKFSHVTETFDLEDSLEKKILILFLPNDVPIYGLVSKELLGRKFIDNQKEIGLILSVSHNEILAYIRNTLKWLNWGKALNRGMRLLSLSNFEPEPYIRKDMNAISIRHSVYGDGDVIDLQNGKITIKFSHVTETFDLEDSLNARNLKLSVPNKVKVNESIPKELFGKKIIYNQNKKGLVLSAKDNQILWYTHNTLQWLNWNKALKKGIRLLSPLDYKLNYSIYGANHDLISIRASHHQNNLDVFHKNKLSIVAKSQYANIEEFYPFLAGNEKVLSVPCYFKKSKLYLMGWHILHGKLKIRWKPDHPRAKRWRSSMICLDKKSGRLFFQGDIHFNQRGTHPIFLK